ncbi:MAG: hypothetical protein K2N34_01745 [Lachnospiraceae bacterium]|nr:hypothetical protein [Lachnospiraceae bacterium]
MHSLYKNAFKETAFTWQVQNYQIQMALENEYQFVFSYGQRMTWTLSRWKFAIINALAIHHFRDAKISEIIIDPRDFRFMCYWLLFQYFNTTVFNGYHFKEIINKAFLIVKDADDEISACVDRIKQWRKDNDKTIRMINSCRTHWRQEKAKINGLLNGCMKPRDIEMCHILHFFHSSLSFDDNIKIASKSLGVSEKALRRLNQDFGIDKMNYDCMLYLYKEDAEIEYQRQYLWAKKVKTNTLNKREKKEFWKTFSIPNSQLLFRTFSFPIQDLIPSADPLLTNEMCVKPTQECLEPFLPYRNTPIGSGWQKQNNMVFPYSSNCDLFR